MLKETKQNSIIKRFPHMLPAESALWLGFLRKFGSGWTNFQYDVHVGEGITLGPDYDVMTQGLAKALTQKRIDALGWRQGVPWIFEVKVQAALSALGQVMGYRALYVKTFRWEGDVRLAIVTDMVMPDDKYVFEAHGIKVFIVEPAF